MGIGTAVCCLISVPWGGGKHLWVVTREEFTKLYQTTFAFVIVYITCISATKISILLFYRRIFGTGVIWYIVFGLATAHWAEVTFTWLAGCQPISYYWEQYTDPTAEGKCINAPLFYFVNGVIGLVIDVAILLVPTPTSKSLGNQQFPEISPRDVGMRWRGAASLTWVTVWKLNLPTTKKVFIGGILLLGGLYVLCAPPQPLLFFLSPNLPSNESNSFMLPQRLRCLRHPHCDDGQARPLPRLHLGYVQSLHLVLLRALHRHRVRLPAHLRASRPSLLASQRFLQFRYPGGLCFGPVQDWQAWQLE